MVQTCWLPDPNERPSFTLLKQTTLQHIIPSHARQVCTANTSDFTMSTYVEMESRYKMIRDCNPVDQRQKLLRQDGKSCRASIETQGYADLDMTRLKETSNPDPKLSQSLVEYSRGRSEEMSLKKTNTRKNSFVQAISLETVCWVVH